MFKRLGIIIVILAIIGFSFWSWQKSHSKKQSQVTQTTKQPEAVDNTEVTKVDNTELPNRFPADFPMDKGAQVLVNQNSEKDGAYQASRSFVTSKTLTNAYTLYNNYLKKNGWTIVIGNSKDVSKFIYATKDPNTSITINLDKNNIINQNTVNVTFVYR